ncbi:MAG: hypothetical protein DRP87_13890 [Spirochaetes bacterium]|nr:MAG: hypothetical protein DRP87_13890 [Spirochaetota bacterium]
MFASSNKSCLLSRLILSILSSYLTAVEAGEEVEVSRRNVPVARTVMWHQSSGELGHNLSPIKSGAEPFSIGKSISILSLGKKAAVTLEPFRRFSISAFGGGGSFLGFFSDDPSSRGANLYAVGGIGATFRLFPPIGLGI